MIKDSPDSGSAADQRSLAASLVPALVAATDGRLDPDVSWFRADWQRGGAATAQATWNGEATGHAAAVLKIPVPRREATWLHRLQRTAEGEMPVVPRIYASGAEVGGADLRWVLMERFPAGPLGMRWHDDHVPRVARAIARFHRDAAASAPVDEPPRVEPWDQLLEESRISVVENAIPERRRWTRALKDFGRRLGSFVATWRDRDCAHWLHGDAHLANAMSRDAIDSGEVSLIDLAEVHAGHWVEDAVYLERQLWMRPERLAAHPPVRAVADARRSLGLSVGADWPRLASVRRALLAATAPKFIRSEGHPKHLAACLDWLERSLRETT